MRQIGIPSGRRTAAWVAAGILCTFLCMGVCLSLGPDSSIHLGNAKVWSQVRNQASIIVWQIRFPRLLLGFLVGGSLSVAGLIFQNLLQTPLADPYLIGVSGGAGLTAVLLQLYGFHSPIATTIGAFVGGLAAMIFVQFLASRAGTLNRGVLILAGVVLNSFFSAMISMSLIWAGRDMPRIFFWLMGSLNLPNNDVFLPFSIACGIGIGVLWIFSHHLDLLAMGDLQAYHLGVNPEKIKWIAVACASVLTASAVAASGMIGFIGMFVPHSARFLFGLSHRLLIPMTFMLGAIILMLTDTVVRISPTGTELPVGALTALLGGPFFLFLLLKNARSLGR